MIGPSEQPAEHLGQRRPGEGIVKASWTGTLAFTVTAALAAAVPETDVVALAVALALFVGGAGAFIAALARAASRSRHEEVSLNGLFFLEGAPKKVRRFALGSLAVEVVVAFTTAGIRPNSSLAFGILAPVWGQGLAGLWGARHNVYPPRRHPPRPGAPSRPAPSRAATDERAVAEDLPPS